jgi:hypothetical protein
MKSFAAITAGVVLALTPIALFSVPILLGYDFPEWDGASYFSQAHALSRHGDLNPALQSGLYSPVFVAMFAGFQSISDVNAVWTYRAFHFLNYAALVAVSFLLLRRVSGRTLGAVLATLIIFLSTVYLLSGLFIVHLFSATLLVAIALASWRPSPNRAVWIAAVVALGVFVRREFLVVGAVLAAVVVIEAIRNRHLGTRRLIALGLVVVAVVGYFGLRPSNNQDVVILCQGYEWNVREREVDYPADPSQCAYAFPRDFPGADNLAEAFFVNPDGFIRHIGWNLSDLGDAFARLVTQTAWWGRVALIAPVVIMLLLVWVLRRRQTLGGIADLVGAGLLWPVAMAFTILVLVPAVTLIGNPDPKYLLALPSVAVATMWGFGRRLAQRSRSQELTAHLALDRVPTHPLAGVAVGAVCFLLLGYTAVSDNLREFSYTAATNSYRFAPIARSIERSGLPPSAVAGTSATSVTAILDYDTGAEPWRPINFATFTEITQSPIAVIDPRLIRRVENEEGIQGLVGYLENFYDFERVAHSGDPDVVLLIQR